MRICVVSIIIGSVKGISPVLALFSRPPNTLSINPSISDHYKTDAALTHGRLALFSQSSNNDGSDPSPSNNDEQQPTMTNSSPESPEKTQIEEASFKGTINPLRLLVLKLGLTELRYTSPFNYQKKDGSYICASCGTGLFRSNGKYDSGSGWPSFWKTASDDAVETKQEWDGRVECSCKKCGGHLGHVFPDGPRKSSMLKEELEDVPETDPKYGPVTLPRFCVNGASMFFVEEN